MGWNLNPYLSNDEIKKISSAYTIASGIYDIASNCDYSSGPTTFGCVGAALNWEKTLENHFKN